MSNRLNKTIQILIASYKENAAIDSVKSETQNRASGGVNLFINEHFYYLILKSGEIKEFRISSNKGITYENLHSL